MSVRLEYELACGWICFVPRRESESGALTKYFGNKRGKGDPKVRGVEGRQRGTSPFIGRAQRQFMETLDASSEPVPYTCRECGDGIGDPWDRKTCPTCGGRSVYSSVPLDH